MARIVFTATVLDHIEGPSTAETGLVDVRRGSIMKSPSTVSMKVK
jgi:hypothetical protein